MIKKTSNRKDGYVVEKTASIKELGKPQGGVNQGVKPSPSDRSSGY